MKVLVTGGRNCRDRNMVFRALDDLHDTHTITLLIQGGARGVDFFAKLWAKERGVPMVEYKADWDRYGNDAGPIRNYDMLEDSKPDLVASFPGGSGTEHMKSLARRKGYRLVEFTDGLDGAISPKEDPRRGKSGRRHGAGAKPPLRRRRPGHGD
jgi:hypothetical protein